MDGKIIIIMVSLMIPVHPFWIIYYDKIYYLYYVILCNICGIKNYYKYTLPRNLFYIS